MNLIKIKKMKSNSPIQILIPSSLNSETTLKKIAFGSHYITCSYESHNEPNDVFYINDELWDHLHLPYEGNIHYIIHEDTLHLGPLIGVFTAGFIDTNLRPIGDRSLFFAKLLEVEQSVGTFSFIFGAHHINWTHGTIKGFFHTKNGWEQIEVPFPNVVYDRLPNRRTENHSSFMQIKQRLKNEYLIPWFNPGFFNKWEIHQLLQNNPSLNKHLPETKINPSVEDIKDYLDKYNYVYLKPANGSLGIGIYKVIQDKENKKIYCRFRKGDQNHLRAFHSLEALIKQQFKGDRLSAYIVQQGINLMKIDKRAIDFRIHTNKNENGNWEMSALAIKVAGRGSVTTHLNAGGDIKTIDEIIMDSHLKHDLLIKLEDTVIVMSQYLEKQIDGLIGEIGFDLGVDKDGSVFLFEANSKPGRSIFDHPHLKDSDIRSRKLPMSYAIYLTRKSITTPEDMFQ